MPTLAYGIGAAELQPQITSYLSIGSDASSIGAESNSVCAEQRAHGQRGGGGRGGGRGGSHILLEDLAAQQHKLTEADVPPPLLVHTVEQLLCFRRKLRPVTDSGHSGKPAAACLPNANSAAAKRKAKLRYALLCRSAAAVRVSFGLIRFAQSRGIAQRVPPCRTAERPVSRVGSADLPDFSDKQTPLG